MDPSSPKHDKNHDSRLWRLAAPELPRWTAGSSSRKEPRVETLAHRRNKELLGHRSSVARALQITLAACLIVCPQAHAQQRVAETVHNLSVTGRGPVRAMSEAQVCLFCHAPHNTAGASALWNRGQPVSSYKIYESSTLDANPGQPTGSSKLCLSCHDGTIALGNVLSRREKIRMAGGDFIPAGLANLGTDLSDDHPVSFKYTSGLAASDQQLSAPHILPDHIKLDSEGRMQCTSCHDPHKNTYGNFLVSDDAFGQLCRSCHTMNGWSASSHRTSNATVSGSINEDWPHPTVAANACRACHRSHGAQGKQRLLTHEREEENCLNCHDGSVARTNIRAQLDKISAHDPRNYTGIHDPIEAAGGSQAHVECSDCHNPHAVASGGPMASSSGSGVGATMRYVRGVNAGGGVTDIAQHEYEVCFRCHGDSAVSTRQSVSRQSQQRNLRLNFSPSSLSFHPVFTTSPSSDTVSLVPGLARGTIIKCTDCHNNDSGPRAGGTGPDGPHGSIYEGLLERNYTTRDNTNESHFEYAMCYKCHQRSSILSDTSFPEHRLHIVNERTPCSACHDPHGISSTQASGSDHSHLINFDTRIVRPEPTTRRMEFRDHGRFAGSCTLTCHGAVHRDLTYGMQPSPTSKPGRKVRIIRP